jgi:hypothetical protein
LLIALALRSARHPVGPVLLTMIVIAWVPGDIKMFTTDTRYYVPFRELGRLLS